MTQNSDVEKIDLTSCVKNKNRLSKTTELSLRLIMWFDELISVGHGGLGELEAA